MEKNNEPSREGEVLPPNNDSQSPASDLSLNILTDIAAHITQYTERPDLFIKALEDGDPGFIKRMNKRAEALVEDNAF